MKLSRVKQRLYLIGIPAVLLLSAAILAIDRGGALLSAAGLVDVLYFTITTLTSVGYGDITPQTLTSRLVSIPHQILGIGILGSLISDIAARAIAAIEWWSRDPGFREVKYLIDRERAVALVAELPARGWTATELVQEYPPKLQGRALKFQVRDGVRTVKYKYRQGAGTFVRGESDARLVEILHATLKDRLEVTRKIRWWTGEWNGPGVKVDIYGSRFLLAEAVTTSRDRREDLALLPDFLREAVVGVVDVTDRETPGLRYEELRERAG